MQKHQIYSCLIRVFQINFFIEKNISRQFKECVVDFRIMFANLKNHYKILFLSLIVILSSCQLQDPNKTHGIFFLENRAKELTLNSSNKNDVMKIIGNPQIKNENNKESWIYLERTLSKGKFHKLGKHLLMDNNVLVLDFDKYGILKNKIFLSKEDINKIQFTKKTTINNLSKKSFVQSFLESVRQKMYSGRKR